jgi:hypothetical protein
MRLVAARDKESSLHAVQQQYLGEHKASAQRLRDEVESAKAQELEVLALLFLLVLHYRCFALTTLLLLKIYSLSQKFIHYNSQLTSTTCTIGY